MPEKTAGDWHAQPAQDVLRDGSRQSVAVAGLVPGDLVLLEAGDRVPADLRLTRAPP